MYMCNYFRFMHFQDMHMTYIGFCCYIMAKRVSCVCVWVGGGGRGVWGGGGGGGGGGGAEYGGRGVRVMRRFSETRTLSLGN